MYKVMSVDKDFRTVWSFNVFGFIILLKRNKLSKWHIETSAFARHIECKHRMT